MLFIKTNYAEEFPSGNAKFIYSLYGSTYRCEHLFFQIMETRYGTLSTELHKRCPFGKQPNFINNKKVLLLIFISLLHLASQQAITEKFCS